MKKLGLALLAVLIIAGNAFAASATITATEYGYLITGGTDTTVIVKDTWAVQTYYVKDKVIVAGIIYDCVIEHTSTAGSFASNLTSGYWKVSGVVSLWISGVTQRASWDTDVSVLTSGISQVSGDAGTSAFSILNTSSVTWDGDGLYLANPRITLGSESDVVYIYVRAKSY